MSIISLDLCNETILKAVIGSLTTETPKNEFQKIIQQADHLLATASLPAVPDRAKIQQVHTLRNDAQHKARYPNETDVNDCRTYTRDFLRQITSDVWGKQFDSISLVDAVRNDKVKGYLEEAERELSPGQYVNAVIKSLAAFSWTFSEMKTSIAGHLPRDIRGLVVTYGFGEQRESQEVFQVFDHMRHTLMRSVIGIGYAGYRKFVGIREHFGSVSFMADGHYESTLKGYVPTVEEAEFVVNFVTDGILQIETLVGDIENPFEI
jgi:hypothetical protein